MPQIVDEVRLHVDHIVARQHHGTDHPDNLALACLNCNLHKGPNLTGIDPDSGQVVALFHPRRDRWEDHFRWSGALLVAVSMVGRATIDVLAINEPANVNAREALIAEGRFPPP
jgi:hypothetical protein